MLQIQNNKRNMDAINWETALKYIPNGTNTLSKCPSRFIEGVYPKFIKYAKDCYMYDYNDNVYVDYLCGLGAIILGYANKDVDSAVKNQINRGTLYSLPAQSEFKFARRLNQLIPCAEKSKFFKNGSDALAASVRVARAITGKEKIVSWGYHGWHTEFQAGNEQRLGIPEYLNSLIFKFNYNDIESFKQHFNKDDIACVVMEPIRYELPKEGFLEEIRDICSQHGALLIFDEVITGCRFHVGGYQSLCKVIPDLAIFSKALGNGFPIAALCGKSQFMDIWENPDFFVSGTYGGDLVGIAAAGQTLEELTQKDNLVMKRIWNSGKELKDGYNYIANVLGVNTDCFGEAPRTCFRFPSIEHKGVFYQEMCKRGYIFGPNNFITGSHSPLVIRTTLNKIEEVLAIMRKDWDNIKPLLEAPPPFEVIL